MDIAQPGRVIQALNGPYPLGVGGPGHDSGVSVLAIVLRFTLWVLVLLAVVWFAREVLRIVAARSHHRIQPQAIFKPPRNRKKRPPLCRMLTCRI